MQELIAVQKITLNGAEVNSVNSREIHSHLEVKTPYSNWIKRAIEKYGFEESQDFTINKFVIRNNAQLDYIVTIDMAKELCMLDDSDKGKLFRKYFIQCEKQLNKPMTVEQLLKANTTMIGELQGKVLLLEDKITTDKPKVAYAEAVLSASNGCSIRDWVSSMKQVDGLKVGERKVISFLLEIKELYRSKRGKLKPYSNSFFNFAMTPLVISTPSGNREEMMLTITGVGQVCLTEKVVEHFSKS